MAKPKDVTKKNQINTHMSKNNIWTWRFIKIQKYCFVNLQTAQLTCIPSLSTISKWSSQPPGLHGLPRAGQGHSKHGTSLIPSLLHYLLLKKGSLPPSEAQIKLSIFLPECNFPHCSDSFFPSFCVVLLIPVMNASSLIQTPVQSFPIKLLKTPWEQPPSQPPATITLN